MSNDRFASSKTATEDAVKTPLMIVGIGNESRGDDGAALFALRNLKDTVPLEVKLAELSGDQTDLIELMRETDNMIIVDAVSSTAPAGTIFRIDAGEESFPTDFFTTSSHGIDIAQSVELARAMLMLPPTFLIYGIAGKDFSFNAALSQQVKEAANAVGKRILDDVRKILAG